MLSSKDSESDDSTLLYSISGLTASTLKTSRLAAADASVQFVLKFLNQPSFSSSTQAGLGPPKRIIQDNQSSISLA